MLRIQRGGEVGRRLLLRTFLRSVVVGNEEAGHTVEIPASLNCSFQEKVVQKNPLVPRLLKKESQSLSRGVLPISFGANLLR
jgi:hypothetical protein